MSEGKADGSPQTGTSQQQVWALIDAWNTSPFAGPPPVMPSPTQKLHWSLEKLQKEDLTLHIDAAEFELGNKKRRPLS